MLGRSPPMKRSRSRWHGTESEPGQLNDTPDDHDFVNFMTFGVCRLYRSQPDLIGTLPSYTGHCAAATDLSADFWVASHERCQSF